MTETVAPNPQPAVDGRSARSRRTRDAVVAALLALLRDGNMRPTAKEIAERAGISLRSVYVHFDDVEDLFCAAAQHEFRGMRELLRELPSDGAFAERLGAFVAQREMIWKATGPVRRAASLQEPFSPTISRMFEAARVVSRAEIDRVFAPELQPLGTDEREATITLCDIVAGSETWDHLVVRLDRDVKRAAATVERGLTALLGVR